MGTTPHSPGFMPRLVKPLVVACHRSIAALPVAKSFSDWLAEYSALPGAAIFSLASRST